MEGATEELQPRQQAALAHLVLHLVVLLVLGDVQLEDVDDVVSEEEDVHSMSRRGSCGACKDRPDQAEQAH